MKLAIVGSRSLKPSLKCIGNSIMESFPSDIVTSIISGGASGVDEQAKLYALQRCIQYIEIKPDYKKYKDKPKYAPIARNKDIVSKADKILVLWDGKSKGSKFVIDYANQLNKEISIKKL